MAMTLMIENISNDFSLHRSGRSTTTTTPSGCYHNFYQSKLRQLLTQLRYRKEQQARIIRQNQSKNPLNDINRTYEQRLHKEYMNHIRERSKIQSKEILSNRIDEQKKRSDSVLSNSSRIDAQKKGSDSVLSNSSRIDAQKKRSDSVLSNSNRIDAQKKRSDSTMSNSNRTTLSSISPTNIITSIESRPKSIVKPKQTSVPPKYQRIISAPISCRQNQTKPKITPTIEIDCIDENLSTANVHSFTQVSSSSSQNPNNQTFQHARQLILDTILLHLDSHMPSNVSKWPTYEDIDNKFSSSIAPTVYRNFERIII